MKTVNIRVIPNSKKTRILTEKSFLKIYIKEPAVDGKANKALVEILSDYFQVKKSDISIVKGIKSRQKIIKIN